MSTVVSRLKQGDLLLKGEVNERLPFICDGLVSHFPMDGKGGTFDGIGGFQPVQHTTGTLNLIEAMNLDWRNPENWIGTDSNVTWDEDKQALKFVGYHNAWIKTPVIVDYNKHYFITAKIYQESGSSTNVLYLGGYGTTATGVRYTGNYDYNICTTYDVPLGQWITVGTNRYGLGNTTGWQGGQGGIIVNPIGWTGDVGVATKYYFGGLFNYNCQNSTDVIYIKDLSIVIIDADNSNCTFTDDGVSIEEATTNLINPNSLGIYTWWTRNTQSITLLDEKYNGQNIYRLKLSIDTSEQLNYVHAYNGAGTGWYMPGVTYNANTPYTASVIYRPVSHSDIQVTGLPSNIAGWGLSKNSSDRIDESWLKFAVDRNYSSTLTDNKFYHLYCPSAKIGDILTIDLTCNQIEQKPFATSFVVGSRNNGSLIVPFKAGNSGTIVFDVIKHGYSTVGANDNGAFISCNNTSLYIFTGNTKTLQLWAKNTSGTETNRIILDSAINTNIKYKIAFTWSTTNCSLYLNGGLVGTYNDFGYTYIQNQNLYIGCESVNGRYGNVEISNFSIYNRALTDDEIYKLANQTFKLTSVGDLIIPKIIEKPNSIPSDAFYFPLDFDSKDQYKAIIPIAEANTLYEDGSIWVGQATTNLWTNHLTAIFSSAYNGANYGFGSGTDLQQIIDSTKLDPNSIITKVSRITGGTSQSDYVHLGVASPLNSTRVISFWYYGTYGTLLQPYNNDGCAYLYYLDSNGVWQGGAISISVPVVANKWQKITLKMVNRGSIAGTGFTWMILHSNVTYNTLSNKEYWKFTKVQIEDKVFPTPFVNGTRNISELEFNLNSSLGLNWAGDWSIVYWKRPVGTYDNTLTGYNIESLGCNSNSVGGGYAWWGKNNGLNQIYTSLYGVINPIDLISAYFNNWHMISMTKTGTTITMKFWGVNGAIYTVTGSTTNSVSNYYVTQYGYDFKLGGWDNGNPPNSYYKDLIIAKRVLTDAELIAIYKTQMRVYKDKLQLQGSIMEGGI